MNELIEKFRKKLSDNGQSLKWWHANHAPKGLKYNYFICQINTVGSLKDDLAKTIGEYVEAS